MRKETDLERISDGKLYDYSSYVKADAGGCVDCSVCCHHIDGLVEINPYDMYQLMIGTRQNLEALSEEHVEWLSYEKISLPYLKLEPSTNGCTFLNEEGRCQIHGYRPSICRLFPLGRVYFQGDIKLYFQKDACVKSELESVQVKDWIGVQDTGMDKEFLMSWYQLIKAFRFRLKFVYDEEEIIRLNTLFKDALFTIGHDLEMMNSKNLDKEFYITYSQRLTALKKGIGVI